MRVVHVIESLGIGGAESALVALAGAQVRGGAEVTVVALESQKSLADDLERAGVRVVVLGAPRSANPLPKAAKLRAILHSVKPDVVHSHLLHADILVGLAASGAARVTTLHNMMFDAHPARTLTQLFRKRALGLILHRRFDSRIAVSRAVGDHYAAHLKLGPPIIVPNAVRQPQAGLTDRAGLASQLGLDPEARWIVNPARLVVEKGQCGLIAGFIAAQGACPDLQLVIAGKGPLYDKLRDAALPAGNRVVLTNELPPAQLGALMGHAHFGILPSLSEGAPVALVEMMLAGLPIIASAVGGIPELIRDGETGLLIERGEPAAVSAAITRLAHDPALAAKCASGARELAEKIYRSDEIAAAIGAVYQQAIERRASS
ncbi:MAG: glycosyltransferase family 4 protein [Novosphingobium sp.]